MKAHRALATGTDDDDACSWVRWAACGHPRSEGDVSGDTFLARADGEVFLVVVVDGLGHGPSALTASEAAMQPFFADDAFVAPLTSLVERGHKAARETRGAVLTVVRVRRSPLAVECIAVGNVDGVLKSGGGQKERIFLAGGVVGFRIPKLRTFSARIEEPLVIALATDGITPDFASDPLLDGPFDVERTAALLLERHSANNDDALLFLARAGGRAA